MKKEPETRISRRSAYMMKYPRNSKKTSLEKKATSSGNGMPQP